MKEPQCTSEKGLGWRTGEERWKQLRQLLFLPGRQQPILQLYGLEKKIRSGRA